MISLTYFTYLLYVAVMAGVKAQNSLLSKDFHNNPSDILKPHYFSYNIQLGDSAHSSRSEIRDDTGRVQGTYSLNNGEGHYRIVKYTADENGFQAIIRTNEPGSKNLNPANVNIQSEHESSAEFPISYDARGPEPPVKTRGFPRSDTYFEEEEIRGAPVR